MQPTYLFRRLLFFILVLTSSTTLAQECIIQGRVLNTINNEPVPYAVVVLKDGKVTLPATADSLGKYRITAPRPGLYNLEVVMSGFQTYYKFEIELKPERKAEVDVSMEESQKNLGEVTISANPFIRREESPLSMRSIGVSEVKRNPGANRDISKVLQSLPGVASVVAFRNDLIVRGGSPNENRFYLDGIEVPNINHFATQGASGGPVGMLNVDFINEVDFYSGAFPANRGNTLSSVLDIKFKDGRTDKAGMSFALGATDLAATFDGPLGKNSTLIASYRRSYLQFLFAALELPFLPTYNDFQFKYKYKPDNKQEFTLLGLGAYDNVVLNRAANKTEEQRYILGNLPENNQWNYTIGASYRRFSAESFLTVVISRNHLRNGAVKFINNDESSSSNRILDYSSQEIENKFRIEKTTLRNSWKANYGVNAEQVNYINSTFNRLPVIGDVNYSSTVQFMKYGAFGQLSRTFPGIGLVISGGLRTDANTFGTNMQNPLEQLSPRISVSKNLSDRFTFNANSGIFYQLPAYTIIGFRHNNGSAANTAVKYIRSRHIVAGFEYQNRKNARITIEGFYKQYSNYPFGLSDSISIANQGSDFGVVGDEPVDSRSRGRSYGVEFLYQQKLFKGFYGLLCYTWLTSEFTNLDNRYVPSSWDFRHTLSFTTGKTFARNWDAGLKFRFNSGNPFTPFDVQASAVKANWDISGQGVLDNSLVNTMRNPLFHQLDIRVDKKYFFNNWFLNLYLDIQNIYNNKTTLPPYLTVVRDNNQQPVESPDDPSRYLIKELQNTTGTIIPTLGIIVEF